MVSPYWYVTKARPGMVVNMIEKVLTFNVAAPKIVEQTDGLSARYNACKNATITFRVLINSRILKEGERLVRN